MSKKRFADSLDTAVFSTVYVINEGSPILYVYHDEEGDWQFMGAEEIEDYEKVASVVSLEVIIEIDNTVLAVADLPPGHYAVRESLKDKWAIYEME